MPRKRTPVTPEPETGADVFDEQIAANHATATEDPEGSHAAAVGKKEYTPRENPWQSRHDNLAGVKIREFHYPDKSAAPEMQIVFDGKPNQVVIDKMNGYGFEWRAREKLWALPYNSRNAFQTRTQADRAYSEVVDIIREERGHDPARGPSIAF